jgi:hypothetical protein
MHAPASRASSAAHADVHDLTSLLAVIDGKVNGRDASASLTVEELLDLVGRRASGPLLLIVGLVSVSPAALIPGSTWLFATLSLVIAAQLIFHRGRPWLPRAALRMRLSAGKLSKFLSMTRPAAAAIDKVVRPRLTFVAEPPWVIVIAILCVCAALMTYPLSFVPLAPFLPGITIALFGLGITARDGALLLISAGLLGVAGWFIFDRAF